MSKIICEYCGTAYKDTENECPICGNANPQAPQNSEDSPEKKKPADFDAGDPFDWSEQLSEEEEALLEEERQRTRNRARVVCGILALLVILVGAYIGYRFWRPYHTTDKPEETQQTEPKVPCTNVLVSPTELVFTEAGQTGTIQVTQEPEQASEQVIFSVDDGAIASVGENGLVTALAEGETTVSIRCGAFLRECHVICDFGGGMTAPTEDVESPTDPEETEPAGQALSLSSTDFTLFYAGDSATIRVSGLGDQVVTWSSEDPGIATVSGGKVTAVSNGTTTIHAKVGDQDLRCIVRCRVEGTAGNGKLSHTDVTISVKESFIISLTVEGAKVEPEWRSEDESICTVDALGLVTGVASGKTKLTARYDGATYTCVIYVK